MITVAIGRSYDGPLDLLLALVRREGYAMDRLPVAEITRQYLGYLRGAPNIGTDIDVDEGAEFFETASWLVLLKSRALLPKAAGEEAPEQELARVLLGHEELRAAANRLRERSDAAGLGAVARSDATEPTAVSRGAEETEPLAATPAEAPTVHDVLLAARRALEQARAHGQGAAMTAVDTYPLETLYRELEERLAALQPGRGASTEGWFRALPNAEAQAALLLALLELARLGRVLLAQWNPCGPVLLQRIGEG